MPVALRHWQALMRVIITFTLIATIFEDTAGDYYA